MTRKTILLALMLLLLTGCVKSIQSTPTTIPSPLPTVPVETASPVPTPFVMTYPTTNPELLQFSVHIQVVRVADDDGQNLANISPVEIGRQVSRANEIFASSGIRFLFDPQTDIDIVQSSVVANMLGQNDLRWQVDAEKADELAAKYPGKLTVFYRQKPVPEPMGRGNFFWWDYNFAVLSIAETSICEKPDDTALAHEIGHYLGLGNTFKTLFTDKTTAEEAYNRAGYQLASFDGDTFTDTVPDIFIQAPEFQCGTEKTINLANAAIEVPRNNLMSFYPPRTTLTPQQSARARYWLAFRYRNGMVVPSNRNLKNGFEMENITILENRWTSTQVQDMTPFSARNWSGGKQLAVVAGYGSGLMVEFTVDAEAVYLLTLYATTSPDYGILEVEVDDILVNDYVDLYAPFVYPTGPVGMGPYYLTKGTHQMLFKVIKKNDLSSGYNFGLDAITVELQ